ncbi:MAG: isovaleryl-CoA dehydrogenase [Myxococcales bacterium]|nr:isovaleryl-CoA dehydrogenase [Myxococcales bacterium]
MLSTTLDPKLINPTEEHEMLRQTIREFTRKEIEPQAEEYDRKGELNQALLRKVGELGLLGVTIPEEFGGAGMDSTASVIVHEEMCYSDPGFTLAYLAHALLFVNNLFYAANDEQRKRYMPKTLTGEWIGAMGMTEPSAGTDVLGMGTVAVKKGDNYVLNGRKIFITNAPEADIFLVYAKVDGRITSFIVESTFEGFSVSEKIHKMGMRASTMAELILEDVEVPAENLVGREGGGITNMMRNLEIERLGLAAMSLGMANRCLDIMLRYSNERHAFGKPIAEFGQVQAHIGESFAKIEAMRGLTYGAASTIGPDRRNRPASDAAKLFAGRAAKEVADSAMQVLGGYGYCNEYRVEQFLRDAKLIEIGGGTNEAHQKNITRDLCKMTQM